MTDKPEGGNPGDLINFVIVGSQEQVTSALKDAGWLQADKTNKDAVVSALLATLQKNSYMTVPMSILYLFGRPQDFGYERTDPVLVAAQRHHFRIWNSPLSTPQQTVWVGSGTHDIGIEKDQRSANAITHKIDQDVDNERDFIGATLTASGKSSSDGVHDALASHHFDENRNWRRDQVRRPRFGHHPETRAEIAVIQSVERS